MKKAKLIVATIVILVALVGCSESAGDAPISERATPPVDASAAPCVVVFKPTWTVDYDAVVADVYDSGRGQAYLDGGPLGRFNSTCHFTEVALYTEREDISGYQYLDAWRVEQFVAKHPDAHVTNVRLLVWRTSVQAESMYMTLYLDKNTRY